MSGRDGRPEDLDDFRAECRRWLASHLQPVAGDKPVQWGVGDFDVSIFHNLTHDDEHALLQRGLAWQRTKWTDGYAALHVDQRYGGRGLTVEHYRVYREEELRYELPVNHEALRVTVNLIAQTINAVGTDQQKERFLPLLFGGEALACQLFSEPGAGSDLAAVATRAERTKHGWVVNGSKVWASGAQFSQWGMLVARSDADATKHGGITTFLVPMDAPGVEVRPIVQMPGGSSFNEVFLTDVHLDDDLRLGTEGEGWKVSLTTLGFERGTSGAKQVGASWSQLRALAEWAGVTDDPTIRQELMAVYSHERLRALTRLRAEAGARRGAAPGPEGSLGKLLWAEGMTAIGQLAARILGPHITADTGQWGTFGWNDHLLGAPGYRIAGGSDEIQRNIVGERVLGLPPEPKEDRTRSWRELTGDRRGGPQA